MSGVDDAPGALAEATATGDRLTALRALRDRLAIDLDECRSARDVASLSQRLMDVLAQVEGIEKAKPETEGTPLDELAARRRADGRPDASRVTDSARSAQ